MLLCFCYLLVKYGIFIYYALFDANSINIEASTVSLLKSCLGNNDVCAALHCTEKSEQLDWDSRLNIIMGAAKGLAYLHHDCSPRIIHRDIKSSNILLDGKLDARVSDFGLAKLLEDEESHITTIVAGTFGYLAPGKQ